MAFQLAGPITNVEVIAAGPGVRIRSYLRKAYGPGLKLPNGALRLVELCCYEARGIGKRDMKIKRYLHQEL